VSAREERHIDLHHICPFNVIKVLVVLTYDSPLQRKYLCRYKKTPLHDGYEVKENTLVGRA